MSNSSQQMAKVIRDRFSEILPFLERETYSCLTNERQTPEQITRKINEKEAIRLRTRTVEKELDRMSDFYDDIHREEEDGIKYFFRT